jgi:hypothetical protein
MLFQKNLHYFNFHFQVNGVKTQCDVCELKQIDSCTEDVPLDCDGGSRTLVAKGTICIHKVCGLLKSAECTIGGRWVGPDLKEVKSIEETKCMYNYNN